ncbi:hypothetical protein HJA89_23110 [Rhizobium bangladeshense]|nr:hypothetical protein [Rhizobium bangladeshense]MBX4875755.1 hypothetical protein [Rhizobium bangladeshense]MBX4886723.1 hypothetical protein [Rhizobium bangladeshense]
MKSSELGCTRLADEARADGEMRRRAYRVVDAQIPEKFAARLGVHFGCCMAPISWLIISPIRRFWRSRSGKVTSSTDEATWSTYRVGLPPGSIGIIAKRFRAMNSGTTGATNIVPNGIVVLILSRPRAAPPAAC